MAALHPIRARADKRHENQAMRVNRMSHAEFGANVDAKMPEWVLEKRHSSPPLAERLSVDAALTRPDAAVSACGVPCESRYVPNINAIENWQGW